MTTATKFAFTGEIALADADGHHWAQILTVGRWKHPSYGDLPITAADLRELKANFEAGARRFVYADFDHGIARASGDGNGITAGEVKSLELRNGDTELWALFEPTPRARERIAAKEYRYTSADFATAYRDKLSGKQWGKVLRGFALTNTPFIEGMQPLTLGEMAGSPVLFAEFSSRGIEMTTIAEKLGLKADATEEQITAKLDTVLAEAAKVTTLSEGFDRAVSENAEVREALQLADDVDVVAHIRTLAEERTQLRNKDREREADKLLDQAIAGGRIPPAARADYRTRLLHENEAVASSTKELIEKLPQSIPVRQRTASAGEPITPLDYDTKLDEKVKELRAANPKLAYRDALILAEESIGRPVGMTTDDSDGE